MFVILFILSVTSTYENWSKYGGTLENTHFQSMKGAMSSTPDVKWSYVTGDVIESYGPTVADVDGDGSIEAVVVSSDFKVYCFEGVTGLLKWSYATGDEVWASPAVADVDGDGSVEVVVGSFDGNVYCLTGLTGVPKWSYATGSEVWSSPAVADVDGDGSYEVVIGSCDGKVYCLNGVTGGVKWSYVASGWIHRGISIADIDGDNKIEVLLPNYGFTGSLISLNGEDGSLLWTKTLSNDVHDITIADIDGDECVELVVGTAGAKKVWVLDDMANSSGCGPFAVEEQSTANNKQFPVTAKTIKDKVYLSLQKSASVKLSLYNITGRLLNIIYDGSLSSGSYTFTPTINHSGIYFAILRTDGITYPLKIVKF